MTPDEISGARFSDCGKYRYLLWRRWEISKPRLLCILLNPSTADARKDDPTITRCARRAQQMGFGTLEVVNLFAFRSTDPKWMKSQADPVGTENDAVIRQAVKRAGMVLCGWGSHGRHLKRDSQVLKLIADLYVHAYALKINKNGTPVHPLYVAYSIEPAVMK
jgi:hypothetical protein